MRLIEYYQQIMQQQGFEADDAQIAAVNALDNIADNLLSQPLTNSLFRYGTSRRVRPVKGLYLWGDVGRGKTFLMDAFYEILPIEEKHRLHFHQFMNLVHEQLHVLKKTPNALKKIALNYAKKYRVLCLDEMHITDEGDAVIMQGLLVNLIANGVTLITTSNRSPDKLSEDPSISQLFSKAADTLSSQLSVMQLDTGIDYRLLCIERTDIWHTPLDKQAGYLLEIAFHECSAIDLHKDASIIINQRSIPVIKWADGIAWFSFEVICGPPRARIDYIEIARLFHSILIQDIPTLNNENNDYAQRFTQLIDELYDHNVKLMVSSENSIDNLYQGTQLSFEFQRTISRLQEMQSHNYLAREHDP